jgi:type II secretory pathway pseudopilin PulG
MKKYNNIHSENGQTLLEILLAFSISIVVLSSVVLGIVTSLNNIQYTKNQGLAVSYAQEGLAAIRQKRDSSWFNFTSLKDYASNGVYCIDKNLILQKIPYGQNCINNDNGSFGVGDGGIFSRQVVFEHNSSSCCSDSGCTVKGSKATVTVSWGDSKCSASVPYCHKVELISCFSNIDQKLSL